MSTYHPVAPRMDHLPLVKPYRLAGRGAIVATGHRCAGSGRLKSLIRRKNPPMPRSPAPAPAAEAAPTYEQALAELERLIQAMEGGQLPLDQLLASYRRGAELLQSCRTRLQAVEDQVKLLDEGRLEPWAAT